MGHITRDLLPDGGWRPGGAALYAARTASLRGLRVAIVTSATADVIAAAQALLPGVALQVIPAPESTTFENIYTEGGRRQYLRAHASAVRADDIPRAWHEAPITFLAPVANDFGATIPADGRLVTGLAPQGWLRDCDASGLVRPRSLTRRRRRSLSRFDVVFLSREDLAGPAAPPRRRGQTERMLRAMARQTRRLVVTCGRDGAELWRHERADEIMRFPGFPAREVDPTGAGDVFAMTFLCAFAASRARESATTAANQVGDLTYSPNHAAERAMIEANQVAALSVEGQGVSGVQSPEAARARYAER